MRVLLASTNASERMGGEAILPLHYLRELNALGLDVTLVTHARCRRELSSGSYAGYDVRYVEDSRTERAIWGAGKRFPKVNQTITNMAVGLAGLPSLTKGIRRILREAAASGAAFDVVHQVTPVSPRSPGYAPTMPAPLVIGPLNGNMTYPEGFERYMEGVKLPTAAARLLSGGLNSLMPGKRRAACILVANARTASGLPPGVSPARVETVVENGVDLREWGRPTPLDEDACDFVFVGRLVHWKALDIVIEALRRVPRARLRVFGDGPKRASWEDLADELGVSDRVTFEGFRPQAEVRDALGRARALLLPSVSECGGAVVLEAMAAGRSVVATNWGGPADYVTHGETGLLIDPSSPEAMTSGFAAAMRTLIDDPGLATRMGMVGRATVERRYCWQEKAKRVVGVYRKVSARAQAVRAFDAGDRSLPAGIAYGVDELPPTS